MENNLKQTNGKALLTAAMLIATLGSLTMIISLFLPYITGGYGEIKNSSMVSYVGLALEHGSEYTGSSVFGIIMLVFVICIGLFSALALLFSLIKKPIPLLIFAVIACIVFFVLCWDFTDRGVVAEEAMSWGAAYYAFIIGTVVAVAGAVFMIIQKSRIKKAEEK